MGCMSATPDPHTGDDSHDSINDPMAAMGQRRPAATSVDSTPGDGDRRYRDIFDAVSDGLIINDIDTGIVLEANPAACRMHGYDDMTGLHPSVFIHPNSHHLFADYFVALREGREFRCRAQDVRKDGTVFDVEVLGRRVSYQGKSAMLGVVRDIGDMVRAYQELEQRVAERTSEIQRRRRVAEGMRELIAVVNSRQTLEEILGYLVEQARSLLESDASAVFLPVEGREHEVLGIRASSGLPPEHPYVRMPVNGSSTGIAFTRKLPVLATDLRQALPPSDRQVDELLLDEHDDYLQVVGMPSYLEKPELESDADSSFGMRAFASVYGAFLSIPLALADQTFGTLSLYYHQPRTFSADDISLANAFARQGALAIENARLREKVGQAAVLEERQRLARELHDAVTQTLFSASLISEVIPDLWEKDPLGARRRLDQLRRLTRGALAEMRILLLELRPSALTDVPLSDLLRQLVEAAVGTIKAEVELEIEGDCRVRLEPEAQIGLYRIAQESLNNIVKHAQATHVEVTLQCHPRGYVGLRIRDDGVGFDPTHIPAGHLGVAIMQERAQAIGAEITVTSDVGSGTCVEIQWQQQRGSGG
jgi:PAS domain S-box-containing protein